MVPFADPLAIRPLDSPQFTKKDLDRLPRSHALVAFDHEHGRCVQLLSTADARELARTRLIAGDGPARADLSQVTHALRVWPARCSLEADLLYARLAPELLGDRSDELRRPSAIFLLSADEHAPHPRFRTVSSLDTPPASRLTGPFTTRKRAEQFADDLIDLFDLCRKHELLVLAPDATACVYKELGKCPAACDGSESLEAYKSRFTEALALAQAHPEIALLELHAKMNDASASLEYELAEKLRARLARVTKLRQEPNRLVSDIRSSVWLALSKCADQKSVYAALMRGGHVVSELAFSRPTSPAECTRSILDAKQPTRPDGPHLPAIELITRRFAKPGPSDVARLFVLASDDACDLEAALTVFLALAGE